MKLTFKMIKHTQKTSESHDYICYSKYLSQFVPKCKLRYQRNVFKTKIVSLKFRWSPVENRNQTFANQNKTALTQNKFPLLHTFYIEFFVTLWKNQFTRFNALIKERKGKSVCHKKLLTIFGRTCNMHRFFFRSKCCYHNNVW